MLPRELIFAGGAAVLLGATALLVLGGGAGHPTAGPGPGPDQPAAEGLPAGPAGTGAEGDPQRVEGVLAEAGFDRPRVDTSAWTSGVIVGDVQLAVSILDRIQSIGIVVEECRNPVDQDGTVTRPFRRFVPLTLGIGTPTFEIRDIPFSVYGYAVRVHSPGLNGSQQSVAVTQQAPYHEVVLSITRGSPYSVLLRDQDQVPIPDADVFLVPFGEPPGRPTYRGKTDNFGSSVLEEVLSGEYRIFVGHIERPLAEPVDVTVFPAVRLVRGAVQGQGTSVVVPRGQQLVVAVVDAIGRGIEGAHVKVLATDRTRLSVLEAQSDWSGRATFPFLPPGSYQIDVSKADWEVRSRSITVTEGEALPGQTFNLARIR